MTVDTPPETHGQLRAFQFWAKTGRNGDEWHALPYHLIDVGAAAETLWSRLPAASRRVPSGGFGDEERAMRIVSFLASTHDIGKANPFFQAKVDTHRKRLGLSVVDEPAGHGQATSVLVSRWLRRVWGWDDLPSNAVGKTSATGSFTTRAFYGDYDVVVKTREGHFVTAHLSFTKGSGIVMYLGR